MILGGAHFAQWEHVKIKALASKVNYSFYSYCSPPARWGLLDFMSVACSSPPLLSSSSCSTATLDAHCSLSDLNHDHPRPVFPAGPHPRPMFPAGPQPRPSTPSLPCRTSTASIHAMCSLPDLWTSTWDLPSSVCTAGLQRPDRMPEDMPDRMSDRMPEDMPDRMPEDKPDRMPEDMPDRMPESMPGRMSDRRPDRMPEDMPEDMPDRMPEDLSDRLPDRMPEICQNICQKICQIECQIECQKICQIECQKICQ